MILLTSTSDLIQVITGGTQAIKVHASYVDLSGTTVTPGRLNTAIASATTTTVVGSPAASTQRTVKTLSVHNADASNADTVTVQHTDGTTVIILFQLSLLAGNSLKYNEGSGWQLFNALGQTVVTAPASGQFLKATVVLNGTTTFTTGSNTNSIRARLQAAGGAGGAALTATAGANGSGGAGGGYAEWFVAVSPSTGYTCAVGAGGTGVSNANGNAGGNTTLTVGGTTCTANGGPGGLVGLATSGEAVAGASPPAISTNGTINGGGSPGFPGVNSSTLGQSGTGGSSQFGSGGAGRTVPGGSGTGNAAVGFGGGGGGGLSVTAVAELGGAGSNGVLIVEEFS